jgi:hypothetical protein
LFLASEIDESIENARDKIVGNKPYHLITKALRDSFCERDLRFRFETFDDFEKDYYSISGLFDMHTDTRYVCFNFSSNHKTLNLQPHHWTEFKFQVSQAVQHETIHKLQWQHRDVYFESEQVDFRNMEPKIDNEERCYLADIDEIDAYGHDIAMEIKHYYPNENPINVLNRISRTRKIPSYMYYARTFKGCEWTEIRKKLIRRAFKWIKYV